MLFSISWILLIWFVISGSLGREQDQDHNDKFRIIGGTEAIPHEFPFIVWIHSINYQNDFWGVLQRLFVGLHASNCAGVILTEDWVATAAHCVDGKAPSAVKVIAGVHDRRDLDEHVQTLGVRRIVVHHNYVLSEFNASSDIALLQLASRFRFNWHVKPLEIESSSTPSPAGSLVTIPGWGLTSATARQGADKLRKLTTTIVSSFDCKIAYRNVIPIEESLHICTDTSKATGSCFGDSGSPVLCHAKGSTKYTLCGIVSGGKGCADPNYYQVNTNVSYFSNWIKKIVYNRNNFVFRS